MKKIALIVSLSLIIGCIMFFANIEKTTDDVVITGRQEDKIDKSNNGRFSDLTDEEKSDLKNRMKAKILNNGKLKKGALSLDERDLLVEMLNEKYAGKITNNIDGNILEYLISNL